MRALRGPKKSPPLAVAEEALLRQGRGGKKSPSPASAEEALLRQVRGGEVLGHKPRQGSESQKKVSSKKLWTIRFSVSLVAASVHATKGKEKEEEEQRTKES